MFDKELAYFIAHQDELVARYHGKILVLHGAAVSGVFDSALQAYADAIKRFGAGQFMLQECRPGPSAYTVTVNASAVYQPA